jgi:hypothetical protein
MLCYCMIAGTSLQQNCSLVWGNETTRGVHCSRWGEAASHAQRNFKACIPGIVKVLTVISSYVPRFPTDKTTPWNDCCEDIVR